MLVTVRNLNVHEYREKFRGAEIVIPAEGSIEMDEDEALYFLQAFTMPAKDSQGRPDPKFFKKLTIEYPPDHKVEVDPLVCHATGQKAGSVEELTRMVLQLSDRLVKDEDAESFSRKADKSLKKENESLKARIQALEEKFTLAFGESESDAKGL